MARITYITNESKVPLFHLSRSSSITKTLSKLLGIEFKNLENESITEIPSTNKTLDNIESRIKEYLELRNDADPAYGIMKNKLFKEEDMYELVSVLGKKMSLFYGNEDGIIRCLAKIHNELSNPAKKILLFAGESHSSVVNFINNQSDYS